MNTKDIIEKLKLETLKTRNWSVQAACGINGDGLREGFDWLGSQIEKVQSISS